MYIPFEAFAWVFNDPWTTPPAGSKGRGSKGRVHMLYAKCLGKFGSGCSALKFDDRQGPPIRV
jgi:hypothetical protein